MYRNGLQDQPEIRKPGGSPKEQKRQPASRLKSTCALQVFIVEKVYE
jgi:hypothetical protein